MKHILVFFLLGIAGYTSAQTIQLINKSNLQALANAVAMDKNKNSATSNQKGFINLEALNKNDTISISCMGFKTIHLVLAPNMNLSTNRIEMEPNAFTLDEIIFSATRSQEKKTDVPHDVTVITKENIEFSNQQNSGDLLQNTGQVFVQKSQLGGGSPILRGFEANKVMLVVDGVRMNNAIYRGGHLQDVISLDPMMLDRVEILFGPGATMYGSDALGGVMHFFTKNAQFSDTNKLFLKLNTYGRYSTANKEQMAHIDVNLGWKKFASLTNITATSFNDLRAGTTILPGFDKKWNRDFYVDRINDRDTMIKNADNRVQKGSAYQQIDVMQRFNYKVFQKLILGFNGQLSTTGLVPRYDRLTDMSGANLANAEWNYGPQTRVLTALQLKNSKAIGYINQMAITASFQSVNQSRITRKFKNNVRKTQEENVKVLGLNADFESYIYQKHTLHYGLETNYNLVSSKATFSNIVTNSVSPADTRYPNAGSTMLLNSIYLSDYYKFNATTTLHGGVRFNSVMLTSKFTDTTFFKFPYTQVKQNNTALSGHIGMTFAQENDYKVNIMASSGFRAPNVDDMGKFFDTKAGSQVIVPNSELKPEFAYNFELSISKIITKRLQIDFGSWVTSLEQAIVVREFKFNGADSIMYNSIKTEVVALQNTDRALLYGVNGGFIASFNDQLSLKNTITYTYGRYTDAKAQVVTPLDHIPPVFGQTSLLYRNKGVDGEFFVRYNGKKSLKDYSNSGEDNLPYATADGMPAWFTLNVRSGFNITKYFRIGLACENILDVHYRTFAGGISAPGRNFIASLKFTY